MSHFCDAGLCVEDVWGLHCAGGPQFLAAVNGARDDQPEPKPAAKTREIWADALAGVPADFWRGDAERRATKRRPARAAALPRARKSAAARTAVFGALVDGGPLETGVAHACVVVLKDAAGRDVARGGWAVAAAAAGDAGAVAAAVEDRGDGTVAVSATPPRRSTYVELAVSVDGAPVGPFRVPCYDAAPSPRAPPDEPGSPPRLAPVAPPPDAAVALCPRRTKLLALPSARDAGAQVVLRAVDAAGAAVGATAAAAACDVAAAARVAGGALAPVAAALADGIGALTVDVDRPAGAAEATVAVTVAAPGGARVHVAGSPLALGSPDDPPETPEKSSPAKVPEKSSPATKASPAKVPETPEKSSPEKAPEKSPEKAPPPDEAATPEPARAFPEEAPSPPPPPAVAEAPPAVAEVLVRLDKSGPLDAAELLALNALLQRHNAPPPPFDDDILAPRRSPR